MNNLTQPPTQEEITSHRETMNSTDKILNKPQKNYSDDEVAKSLTEDIEDSGGCLLNGLRGLDIMLEAYKGPFR